MLVKSNPDVLGRISKLSWSAVGSRIAHRGGAFHHGLADMVEGELVTVLNEGLIVPVVIAYIRVRDIDLGRLALRF